MSNFFKNDNLSTRKKAEDNFTNPGKEIWEEKQAAEKEFSAADEQLKKISEKPDVNKKILAMSPKGYGVTSIETKKKKTNPEEMLKNIEKKEKPTGEYNGIGNNIIENMAINGFLEDYERTRKNTKTNVEPEDLSFLTKIPKEVGAKNWDDFVNSAGYEDLEYVADYIEKNNGSGPIVKTISDKLRSRASAVRTQVGAMERYNAAQGREDELYKSIVEERIKALKDVKAEDYVYSRREVGIYDGEDINEYESWVQNLYKDAEIEALNQIYSLDELDVIEKNVLKNSRKYESDFYNTDYVDNSIEYGAKENVNKNEWATKVVALKEQSDWEEKSAEPEYTNFDAFPAEYSLLSYEEKEKFNERANKENELFDYLYRGEDYGKGEFSDEEIKTMKAASDEEKKVIAYLFRTNQKEEMKSYITSLRPDAKNKKIKNDTYAVGDATLDLKWNNEAKRMQQNKDWEENSKFKNSTIKPETYIKTFLGLTGDEKAAVNFIKEDEKKVLAYLINNGDVDSAKSYLKSIKSAALERRAEEKYKNDERLTKKHPVLSNLKVVAQGVPEGVKGAVDMVAEPIKVAVTGVDKPYDTNSIKFDYQRSRQAVMESTKEMIKPEWGDFVYDTTMSIADNTLRTATTAGVGAAIGYAIGGAPGAFSGAGYAVSYTAPVIASGSAYKSSMYDAIKRGATNEQARLYGTVTAATEFVTERMGADNLVNAVGESIKVGKFIKPVLMSGAGGAIEETAAWAAELVYDDVIMGEKSNYNQKVSNYIKSGLNEEEATKRAMQEVAIEGISSAVGGFLAEGIMGAAGGYVGGKVNVKAVQSKVDTVISGYFNKKTEWDDEAEVVYKNLLNGLENIKGSTENKNNITAYENEITKVERVKEAFNTNVKEASMDTPETEKIKPITAPIVEQNIKSGELEKIKKALEITTKNLSEGAWTYDKEAVYTRTITSLEDMYAKSDDGEFRQGISEEISRVKDVYVSGKFGSVMSIEAAIEKEKGEEERLQSLWTKGEAVEAVTDIEEQIRTAKDKRASFEELKAFNEAGFDVKYFSAPDKSELNGVVIGSNVYVNLDGKEAAKHTVGHEFVHMLKKANPDAYDSYVNAVMKTIDESTMAKLFEEYTAKYGDKYQEWNEGMFWEEYAADVAGDLVQDVTYGKSLINAIVSENTTNDVKRSKLRAIGEVLQNLARKLHVAWRKHTGTYKMGEAARYVNNLVEVHKELLRAYHGLGVDNAGVDGIMESRSSGRGKGKKDYWRPDLSNAELEVLNRKIRHDIKTSTNEVTDTANWMFTSINGKDVFAIYSTTDESNPTLLYESKDNRAKQERDLLIDILEVGTNGENFNGQSSFANRVSEGDWLQNEYSMEGRSDGVFRRKGSVGNASVLQGESSTYGSAAFRNLIENIFEIQDGINSEYSADKDGEIYVKNEPRLSVSSPDVEERSSIENRAYEIETAVSDRLSEMLEVKLTDATRDAVKVYALSSAMGDEARIRASLEKLTDSIIRKEAPVIEVQAEDDGFLEALSGIKKVYVSDYARQGMSVSDVNRTFGIGRWSGKEGLPVDVLYNNMVNDGITLPEADTIQDKLIAIRDRKAELMKVRREALPRDEVRSIIDYAVDLGDYKTSGISEDIPIPEATESRSILDEEFKSQRRALQEEIENLPEDAYEERFRLTQEKNQLEKDFVEGYIAHGKGKSVRDIAMDFCTMTEAEEQVARAKLKRSEEAAREARVYARENGMTQAMTSAARAMAEGNMTESELNTKYRNASDRVKIMELGELYKRVSYTAQNLKSEQRATLYEVCDILLNNASYMKDLRTGHGQIDTFESLVNYICRVDSLKDSFSDKVPEDVRRELTWAAKQLNSIFYYSIQDNTEGMNQWKNSYKEKLKELGIKKRSAESAAAQALGEGFWNEDDLTRAGFNDEQRKNIVELSNYLKEMYKEILPEINKIRFAQGEGDISAPTFKVDKQTAGELAKMQLMVDKIKYNSKSIDNLKASDVKEYADKNNIRVEAIEAYRTYGKDDFAKHINWRYKNAQGRSEGDMAQWAWNLIQSGKRYDRSRGTIEMDYFPHLEKGDAQNAVLQFLNIRKTIDKLPTAISGMTENFKPNKKWSPFMQERLGNETEWDSMTGAERYLDSIGMYMYHASDITKVRILENYIREAYGSNSGDKYVLSNFAQYLRQYGDDLAGKQHKIDRALQETFIGRRMAQWWRALMTNISRNQLGANISTTITNGALYGQGVSWVVRETIYEKDLNNLIKIVNTGMGKSKDYIQKSTFLKNRFHDDVQLLDKNKAINVIAKINNGMFKPMQIVDMVATTRVHKMMASVYMNQGMNEADAIENADIALRQLAASREYGEKPLIFSSNTASLVTKYTLEPLNQMRYYKNQFSRMTQAIMNDSDTKTKATVKTAGMLILAVAADALIMHLMNYLFKKLKGYPVVMDPVQMAIDTWGNLKEGNIKGAWLDTIDEVPIANNIIKATQGEVTDMIVIGNLIDFVGGVVSIPGGKTNWEEFLWNAGMIFNPLGGTAQAKKMVQAYKFLTKGYQEKNEKVQYATDATAWDWAVGLLFGKSAIPSVQEWYDNGYKKLDKDSSRVFKALIDDSDVDPEKLYDMMLEYEDKKKNEDGYDAYKWVTEDLSRYGTFSDEDKYYLWHMLKDRKCDIPERLSYEERKIAEVFIATGDTGILIDEMSDEITVTAGDVEKTYYLDEEQIAKVQSEYERNIFNKMHGYMSLKGSEKLNDIQWINLIKKAKSEAEKEIRQVIIDKEWFYAFEEVVIENYDNFIIAKNDMAESEITASTAFGLYLELEGKNHIDYDIEKPTHAQMILAEAYMISEEEPTGVLPAEKKETFSANKKTYKLTEEQHEEFQRVYNQYYWDSVEEMNGWSSEEIMAQLPKVRNDATKYAVSYMLSTYGDELTVEE